MRLLSASGILQWKNCNKYKIDWDKPSRSKIQKQVKDFLRPYWEKYTGVYEEFPVFGTKLKVDFICISLKIAVEVHGPQHENYNKFFHNGSRLNFLNSIKRDVKKMKWLELNGFRLVEIYFDEIKELGAEFYKKKFTGDE